MQEDETLLEARGIGRRAAAGDWLLRDIRLALHGGQRPAVVGPSGSGKTLLLRALALLDPLQAGEIRWKGQRVRGHDVPAFRSRVMYLPQHPALLDEDVEQNLKYPFRLGSHRHKRFDRQRTLELLRRFGRDESFLARQQRDLSGGEAQLAALLRVVQLEPQVLLLDEPTAALDAGATQLVETLVSSWLDEAPDRRAAVWVTHDFEQAHRVSDSLWQLDQGCLRKGTARDAVR